jgi:localization factor PodJL
MMRAAAWGGKVQEEDAVRQRAQRSVSSLEGVPTRLYASQLKRMESTLNSLLESVASSIGAEPPPARRRSYKPRPSLGAAIAEVARRQKELDEDPGDIHAAPTDDLQEQLSGLSAKLDEMRREQAARYIEPAPACRVDKVQTDISNMSETLQGVASHDSVAALEHAIRALSQRTEVLRSESIREAMGEPLEQLAGEFKRSLAEIDPRATIASIERELKELGTKLDDRSRLDANSTAFRNIQQQTREICDLLTAALTRPQPIERIEQQIEQLGESIERQRAAGDDTGTTRIEERLDALAAKIEEALVEARDESHYEALARRIDKVHRELAASIAERPGMDSRPLEDLVCELTEKLEQTKGQPDVRALNALERQIAELVQRFEISTSAFASLTSLEQTINARFAELEQGRRAALKAAESSGARGAEPANIGQELQRLRVVQDEADRRTASTLNAVHETLERVVDRLAMMEDDLVPRSKGSNELLASGPAPVFAPAPQRASRQNDLTDLGDLKIIPEQLPARRDGSEKAPLPPAALEDLLIEPGSGFPARREEGNDQSPRARREREQEGPATRADFIAAARRAAQLAQTDSAAVVQSQARSAVTSKSHAGLISQARNFVAQHKRPVVLSLALLFVAIGAYALVKTIGHTPPTSVSSNAATPDLAMTVPRMVGPPAIAPAPAAVLPHTAALAPPPANGGVQQPAPSIDTMPTGSIPQPKGVAPDTTQSDPEAAAAAGDAKAQFLLATNYAEGRHVPRNFTAAAAWYAKAAAQGLAPAQYRLASLYEKGIGVTRDLGQARSLYQKAAQQGNIRAMHNLAVLSADGGDDGKPDYATAAQWFKKAAEYGVRDSQYNLAVLLARGLGVRQNFVAAYMWFSIVAAQGDNDAARKRDDVGARLNANELAAAKAMADAFHAKTPDPVANDVQAPIGGWTSYSPALGTTSKAQHPKITVM